MTTIAVNRTSIACDRQFTYNGSTKMIGDTKVFTFNPDVAQELFNTKVAYCGFCGDAGAWGNVVNWFIDPSQKPPKVKEIEMILLTGKKEIYYANSLNNWMEIHDKYWSIGSGMPYALAAMATGKTPLEACKVASKFDVMTGMGYREYKL